MSFANSDALFPSAEFAATIAAEYDEQYKVLCYGRCLSWEKIQARLLDLPSSIATDESLRIRMPRNQSKQLHQTTKMLSNLSQQSARAREGSTRSCSAMALHNIDESSYLLYATNHKR
jgi:hypothetical protein